MNAVAIKQWPRVELLQESEMRSVMSYVGLRSLSLASFVSPLQTRLQALPGLGPARRPETGMITYVESWCVSSRCHPCLQPVACQVTRMAQAVCLERLRTETLFPLFSRQSSCFILKVSFITRMGKQRRKAGR